MAKKDITGQTFGILTAIKCVGVKEGRNGKKRTVWLLECECGEEVERTLDSLQQTKKRGARTNCDCERGAIKKDQYNERDINENLKHKPYFVYKIRSKRKEQEFTLTKEDFQKLIYKECYYCSSPPSNTFTQKYRQFGERTLIYQGLDRIDSSLGYIPGNVVPCCKDCNLAKNDYSQEFFLAHVQNIYNHLKEKGRI